MLFAFLVLAWGVSVGKFNGTSTWNSTDSRLGYTSFVGRGSTVFNVSNTEMCVDRAGVFLIQYQWCGSTNATFSVVTPGRTISDRASSEYVCRSGCAPAYFEKGECAYATVNSNGNSSYWSMVDWNFTAGGLYSKNASNTTLALNSGIYVPRYTDFYELNPSTNAQSLTYPGDFAGFTLSAGSFYYFSAYVDPRITVAYSPPTPAYGFYQSTQLGSSFVQANQNSSSFGFSGLFIGAGLPMLPSFFFSMDTSIVDYAGDFDFSLANVTSPSVFFVQNTSITPTDLTTNFFSIAYPTAFLANSFYLNSTVYDSLHVKTSGWYLISCVGGFVGQQGNLTLMYLEVERGGLTTRFSQTSLIAGDSFVRTLSSAEVLYLHADDRLHWRGEGARADVAATALASMSIVLLETITPTNAPSRSPSIAPVTSSPSKSPSRTPSKTPTVKPSIAPTFPTSSPTTKSPTRKPTTKPTNAPTRTPTLPTRRPTVNAYDPSTSTAALATVSATLSILGVALLSVYACRRR